MSAARHWGGAAFQIALYASVGDSVLVLGPQLLCGCRAPMLSLIKASPPFFVLVTPLMDHLHFIPRLSLLVSLLVPAAAGLSTYFVYKKHEIPPSNSFLTALLLLVSPLLSSSFLFHHYTKEFTVFVGFSVFYVTLLSCIVLYRVSPWHPLAKYPGPLLAKVSQFWLARATAEGRWHVLLKDLHAQYGPYVRIGPNQLSFIDASLIPKIMGPDGMPKGPMFDGARIPGVPANVVAIRNLTNHTQLRKPWTKGLSSASVKEYAPTIVRRALQLADELERFVGVEGSVTMDLAMWMSRFAFDLMGDMVFGGAFELMKDGDQTGIYTMIDQQMKAQAVLQCLPWSSHIVHKLPVAVTAMAKFTRFVNECVARRSERGARIRDLFYHLAHEDSIASGTHASFDVQAQAHELALLRGNYKVAIVAGSDTTATTLSNVFFYLLTNPSVLVRLREELDGVFPPGEGDPFEFGRLVELGVLNAVINETLRLQPPLPTDLQRALAAGCGSKQIGSHIIPEGTSINIPPYVFHRQARYFSLPETFWIDRWLHSPSPNTNTNINSNIDSDKSQSQSPSPSPFIHDTRASIPFSHGPANCAGKMLALAEIRYVIALLLQRFEIRFEAGYERDPGRWEREMKSYFVCSVGKLPVVLAKRVF